jgi:CPA1 family monovalent cation:H+ antiporter
LVGGWTGLRGSVSLAAALALPPTFPERGLLIWLTLCVIFATLVVQGLTLPKLISALDVHDDGRGEEEELHARREATAAAIAHLQRLGDEEWTRDETIDRMLALYGFRDRRLRQRAGEAGDGEDEEDLDDRSHTYQRTVREVLDAQRRRIIELRDAGAISDDVLHALERELDLEDQRLEI